MNESRRRMSMPYGVTAVLLIGMGVGGCDMMHPKPSPAPVPAQAALPAASTQPEEAPPLPAKSANGLPTAPPEAARKAPPTTAKVAQVKSKKPRVDAPSRPAAPPPSSPKPVASTPASPKPAAVAAVPPSPAAPTLDLAALEQRLKDTHAIGVFTKLSLKNQVDDLLGSVRAYHGGTGKTSLSDLRQRYDLLLLKVLTLLQDGDPPLASAIASSREALWGILADPEKFHKIQLG